MHAYKIMRSRHYQPGTTVSTASANYGNRLALNFPTQMLARMTIEASRDFGLGFDEILQVCLAYQNGRQPARIPFNLPLSCINALVDLSVDSLSVEDERFSALFWETLYEEIRQSERPDRPCRRDSYFACTDMDALKLYRDTHWSDRMHDKVICQIDVAGCSVRFDADMVILDQITPDMDYEAARPQVLRYWDQEVSDRPIMETLLQGTVVLGALQTLP